MAKPNVSEMVLVAQGKAYWSQRVEINTRNARRALDAGQVQRAAKFCERAQTAQRALNRWERIENNNIVAGMTPVEG